MANKKGLLNISAFKDVSRKIEDAPIQTHQNNKITQMQIRSSFFVDRELYKNFKTFAVKNDVLIKDLFEIRIKEKLQDKKKVRKEDYLFDYNSENLSKHTLILSKSLKLKLNIWLDENDIYLRDFLMRIILDCLNK